MSGNLPAAPDAVFVSWMLVGGPPFFSFSKLFTLKACPGILHAYTPMHYAALIFDTDRVLGALLQLAWPSMPHKSNL